MKYSYLSLSLLLAATSAQAQFGTSTEKSSDNPSVIGTLMTKKPENPREMVLGNLLKRVLEYMHLSQKEVNDEISKDAFKVYLERIDYGKQFLLEEDVKKLKAFEIKFDDMMISGDLQILDVTTELMNKRIGAIEAHVEKILSKPMDFSKKETIETDPKKRQFLKSEKDLFEHWNKLMKYEVLNRIVDTEEEQKGVATDAKGKKKPKPTKQLSAAEIEKEAREKVLKSWKKIFSRLVNEKKSDKLDKFYNAITKVFDPHTNYLIPEEKEDFDIDMSGKLEGIGAILREDNSYIKIEKVVPGSASWKTKELDAEDTILKVGQGDDEPVDVVDMSLRDAVKLIRGKKGTVVKLTVKKPNGLIKVVPIVRDVVEIEESYAKGSVLELGSQKMKVGYINIPKFYRDFNDPNGRSVTDDTLKEMKKLINKGVEGLILDLRNNGGGALEDARKISGLFIEEGPIVQVKGSSGSVDVLSDDDPKIEFSKPVIVLINRFSASASEIVAAALQDYKRAVIVGGEFSHGKGTVQAVIDLDGYIAPVAKAYSPMGALKITIQKFYRVNGSSTQYKGVTPDIVLPDQYSHLESGEKFLDYSIPWGEVKPVRYKAWTPTWDIKKLKNDSAGRVAKSEKFKHINDSINWYKEQKQSSQRSLAKVDFEKKREEVRKMSDLFNQEKENTDLIVTDLVDGKKDKAAQEKYDDYVKTLRKDAVLEESMLIMHDLVEMTKKAKK